MKQKIKMLSEIYYIVDEQNQKSKASLASLLHFYLFNPI
jgi:hypothetical protein